MSNAKRNPSRLLFYRPLSDQARLRQARDKVYEYRYQEAIPPAPDATAPRGGNPSLRSGQAPLGADDTPEIEEWRDLISKRIEEAMRRGEFDHLPGHGRPLDLRREPFVPEDQQMAFKLLQNNDLTPAWIAERKDVLKGIEGFRQQVQAIAGQARTRWDAAQDDAHRHDLAMTWLRWITRWEGDIAAINRRIGTLNLRQPSIHLEVFKLQLDDELRRAGAGRKLG